MLFLKLYILNEQGRADYLPEESAGAKAVKHANKTQTGVPSEGVCSLAKQGKEPVNTKSSQGQDEPSTCSIPCQSQFKKVHSISFRQKHLYSVNRRKDSLF